jgi:hypothetical protein
MQKDMHMLFACPSNTVAQSIHIQLEMHIHHANKMGGECVQFGLPLTEMHFAPAATACLPPSPHTAFPPPPSLLLLVAASLELERMLRKDCCA